MLIKLLQPRRIFAIGNDAALAVGRIDASLQIIPVRHPSYGGQTQFLRQVREAYELSEVAEQTMLLPL